MPEQGQKENHCPFGCSLEELEENGYCRHLVGFTNDKKVFEPLVPIMVPDHNGKPAKSGRYKVMGKHGAEDRRQAVARSDRLVNPTFQQLDGGVYHTAFKWLSWRVYREMPEVPRTGPTVEEEARRQRIEELQQELEELEGVGAADLSRSI